jgi:hypothetical protein
VYGLGHGMGRVRVELVNMRDHIIQLHVLLEVEAKVEYNMHDGRIGPTVM